MVNIAILGYGTVGSGVAEVIRTNPEIVKEKILEHSVAFGGTLSDVDLIRLCGISRGTYYKYKKELLKEEERNET